MFGRLATGILVLTALLAPVAQADWPSFHGDARHTGFVAGSSYPVFVDVWWNNNTLAKAQIKASPVIKDNVLITADLGTALATPPNVGTVRALDAASGKELWSFKMGAPVEGTPAVSGERVYVVDTVGTLKALNLRSGVVENTAATAVGATFGSITLNEDKLYIGTEAGEVKAYLASTLTLLWTFRVSDVFTTSTFNNSTKKNDCTIPLSAQPIRGAPAVYDGKVYFGSLNHWVFAVDEQGTGDQKTTVKWVYQTGDVILSAPAINSQSGQPARVDFSSYDGKVYAFKAKSASEGLNNCYGDKPTPDWTFQVPTIIDSATGESQISKVHSSPAAAGDRVFFGANNGNITALNSATGALVWSTKAGSPLEPVTSSPAVANGIVVVGSEDKKVYWLEASSGKILKTFATQAAVLTSPAIDGDRAYVASRDGTLYAFGPEIPRRADLVVSSITESAGALQVNVRNQGDAKSTNTTVRIFVAGTFLANVAVPALDPGQAFVATQVAKLASGSTAVRALVDPDNTVAESNDSNNELTAGVTPSSSAATSGSKKGGIKIPSIEVPAVLALLALSALAMRRRR